MYFKSGSVLEKSPSFRKSVTKYKSICIDSSGRRNFIFEMLNLGKTLSENEAISFHTNFNASSWMVDCPEHL